MIVGPDPESIPEQAEILEQEEILRMVDEITEIILNKCREEE